jgi:anti-anti-sigma factor
MSLQLKRPPLTDGRSGDAIVVSFTGSKVTLDEEILNRSHEQLLALTDEHCKSDLLLDFHNVDYLTSTTLDTLVALHKKLVARGRRLTVVNLSPQVHEIFTATMLDKLLNLRLAGQDSEVLATENHVSSPNGILVVDDEPGMRRVLEAGLCIEGFKVWVAGDGQQAIELYQQNRQQIAVVLLDVRMPEPDGPQTLIALQKLCPIVRCCFMTGTLWPYTEEELLRMGAMRIFRKPFAIHQVTQTLRELAGPPLQRRQN